MRLRRVVFLICLLSLTVSAQPNCDVAPDGRGGTADEQSVSRASALLTDADEILQLCQADAREQWQACREADRLMSEADRMLSHVFRHSFEGLGDGKGCWKCRPGQGEAGLHGVAARLVDLTATLTAHSGMRRVYDSTYHNIRGWIGPRYPYCSLAAHLRGLAGEVEVFQVPASDRGRSERSWSEAEEGQSVLVGDRVRTRRGRARIEFIDQDQAGGSGPSVFHVGEFTEVGLRDFEVTFDPSYARTVTGSAELLRGTIRASFRGLGADSSFSVRAGVAVCSIRGTEFTMKHDPAASSVSIAVAEGTVSMASPQDARVLKAGQSTAMVNGKFP